jgi:hypothetical protein
MTFDRDKIPFGGYTQAAEECSPDRSAIAFFFEYEDTAFISRLIARLRKKRRAAVPPPPASHLPELDPLMKKLSDLRARIATERPAIVASGSPQAIQDYDKVMESKRIAIMSGEE